MKLRGGLLKGASLESEEQNQLGDGKIGGATGKLGLLPSNLCLGSFSD